MELQKPKLIYQQIKDIIRADAKNLEPGTFLGTEVAYAKRFKVSRPTIRKSIDELVAEGVIARIAGIGLQVAHIQRQEVSDKKLLIMVPTLEADDGLFSRVLMGAVEVSNEHGFGYHIVNNLELNQKINVIKSLDFSRYIGVIMTAYDTAEDREILNILRKNNIPFVLVDNPLEGGIYNYVVADDYAGGYLIGEHLSALGHKRILYLAIAWPAVTVQNRMKGLSDALLQHGVEFSERDFIKVDYEGVAQNFILEHVTRQDFDYTAIVCSNDMVSMHCLNALDLLGVRVPDDIAITGFGDYRIASIMRHPLTTIRVPGYKMGSEAARLLLDSTANHKIHKVILDVELIVRETTAANRQAQS